jgi:ATP-dependent DNA helicase PIF1
MNYPNTHKVTLDVDVDATCVDIDPGESNVAEVPCQFITGNAGTGKTYTVRQNIKQDRKWGRLCATTGIAAVNLAEGTDDTITTINSLLGYFDTESMQESVARGRAHRALQKLAAEHRAICIDEVSMMPAMQLDLLYQAVHEVNQLEAVIDKGGFGIVLTGDFCQLSPVKASYCFHAQCWPRFQANTSRLTKCWRQTDLDFLAAINAARTGEGDLAAEILESLAGQSKVTFAQELDVKFDGTTIFSKNAEVDRLNGVRYLALLHQGKYPWKIQSKRWGKQRGEWSLIPDTLDLCNDAYVMILTNDTPEFTYANGSCGWLQDIREPSIVDNVRPGQNIPAVAEVKLKSGKGNVLVPLITRRCTQKEAPEGYETPDIPIKELSGCRNKMEYILYLQDMTARSRISKPEQPYFDYNEEKWIVGEITYLPLRLAYAATVHKTQGLTLDQVQIDYSNAFFGQPSMSYVALSRVKSPNGLRIVGTPQLLARRTNISAEVLPWL